MSVERSLSIQVKNYKINTKETSLNNLALLSIKHKQASKPEIKLKKDIYLYQTIMYLCTFILVFTAYIIFQKQLQKFRYLCGYLPNDKSDRDVDFNISRLEKKMRRAHAVRFIKINYPSNVCK